MSREQKIKIVRKIESELEMDIKDISTRISLLMLQEGQFIHPSKIYGVGLSVVAELIMRERLIIKTKDEQ